MERVRLHDPEIGQTRVQAVIEAYSQHVPRSHYKNLNIKFAQIDNGYLHVETAPKIYTGTSCRVLRGGNQPCLEAGDNPHVRRFALLVNMPVSIGSSGRSKTKVGVSG